MIINKSIKHNCVSMIMQVYYSNIDPSSAQFRIGLAQFRIGLAQIQIPNHQSLLIKGF